MIALWSRQHRWRSLYRLGCLESAGGSSVRFLSASGGKGEGGDDGEVEDGDELFGLTEEDPAEEARRLEEQRRKDLEALESDKVYVEKMRLQKEAEESRRRLVSTELGDSVVDKLKDVVKKEEKVDIGLPPRYAQITPHTIEVLKYCTFNSGKVYAYDAKEAKHTSDRSVKIEYMLRESKLSPVVQYAAKMIAGKIYFHVNRQSIVISSARYDTADENRLLVLWQMERLIREARICVGEKVAEDELRDISGDWHKILGLVKEKLPRHKAIRDYLAMEFDRTKEERMKRDMLSQEYLLHAEVWKSREGIREAIIKAREWKQKMMPLQERALRRIPRDFVEKKAGKHTPRDLVLY